MSFSEGIDTSIVVPHNWVGMRGSLSTLSFTPRDKRSARARPRVRVYKVGGLPSNTLIGCHQPNSTNFRASVFGRVLTVRRNG